LEKQTAVSRRQIVGEIVPELGEVFMRNLIELLNRSRFKILALVVASFTAAASGQTASSTFPTDSFTPSSLATGSPLGSYSLSDIENVNLFNGNLNVTFPLLRIGGRGNAGYTMSLPIEDRWRIQDAYYPSGNWGGGPPPPQAWAHHYFPYFGWWTEGAGFGPGIMRSRRSSTFGGQCPWTPESVITGGQVLTQLTFSGPGGTEFTFVDRRTGGTPAQYPVNTGCSVTPDEANRGNVWITADGSNIVFVASSNHIERPGSNEPTIGLPPGDRYFPDVTRYRIDLGNVTYILDRNGNKTSFTYSSQTGGVVTSITDPLNRVLTDIGVGTSTKTISFKGVGGAQREIEIGKAPLGDLLQPGETLKGANELFPELGADVTNLTTPANPTLTSYVELPDGRRFSIKYNSYGNIARLELPTGGAIEYDWAGIATTGCGAMVRRWVTERRVYEDGGTGAGYSAKTTYAYGYSTVDSVPVKRTTVTLFGGDGVPISVSRHYFTLEEEGCDYYSTNVQAALPNGKYAREIQTESYSADGTILLRKQKKDFGFRTMATVSGDKQVDFRVIRESETLADVSPNLVSKKEFGYDGTADLTRMSDVWEYDFGEGQAGPLRRYSHTDYLSTNPINNIDYLANNIRLVNLVSQTWVSPDVNGNSKSSLTKFEYDNYTPDANRAALVPRSSVTGHDTANYGTGNPVRGNLTSSTSYSNAQAQTGGVTRYSRFDILGRVSKTTDAPG